MPRIIDARTANAVPAAPARRAPTRVEAHAPGHDATGLRVLLVADLLARALELDGTPTWALLTGVGQEERAALRRDADALGIRPFEEPAGAAATVAASTGAGPRLGQRIRVTRAEAAAPDDADVPAAAPAEPDVQAVVPAAPTIAVAPVRPARVGLGDPGALRLALLERHHHARVELEPDVLRAAGEALARRRREVADWARRPSRPVPDAVRERLHAAWENDLDAPAVLRVLHDAATDPDLPDGARFETHAYADRFLGLHLTRDVGTP